MYFICASTPPKQLYYCRNTIEDGSIPFMEMRCALAARKKDPGDVGETVSLFLRSKFG